MAWDNKGYNEEWNKNITENDNEFYKIQSRSFKKNNDGMYTKHEIARKIESFKISKSQSYRISMCDDLKNSEYYKISSITKHESFPKEKNIFQDMKKEHTDINISENIDKKVKNSADGPNDIMKRVNYSKILTHRKSPKSNDDIGEIIKNNGKLGANNKFNNKSIELELNEYNFDLDFSKASHEELNNINKEKNEIYGNSKNNFKIKDINQKKKKISSFAKK